MWCFPGRRTIEGLKSHEQHISCHPRRKNLPVRKVLHKNGFTLMELMLVATILVVIGAAVYGTFASGINIWERVSARSVTEDINLFFKHIAHDVRNSFNITSIKFRGGIKSVTTLLKQKQKIVYRLL